MSRSVHKIIVRSKKIYRIFVISRRFSVSRETDAVGKLWIMNADSWLSDRHGQCDAVAALGSCAVGLKSGFSCGCDSTFDGVEKQAQIL